MTYFLLCILIPSLVYGFNYTNNTNDENHEKLSVTNSTIAGNFTISNTNTTIELHGQITSTIKQLLSTLKNVTYTPNLKTKSHHDAKKSKKTVKPVTQKPLAPIKQDLEDMPTTADVDEIMNALHNVLDFFLENKNDIDMSMDYGLFLLNVNLKSVYKIKRHVLPTGLSFRLKHLLEKNEELLRYFNKMVQRDNDPDDELDKTLITLFNNEELWMLRMSKFDGAHVNKTVVKELDQLEPVYSYFERYLEDVKDFTRASPRPDQSNRCLSFLARNPVRRYPWKKACQIPDGCRNPLKEGTNFGYGLTHRLIYLQFAYYGHRCYVFSNKEDKDLRESFCKKLYSEASYITLNDYGIIDLFVEQVCLCALDGHYEFLRRSWLLSIISFQSIAGCFADKAPDGALGKQLDDDRIWRLDNGEHQEILGGKCNIHTSSAAAAALAFGVKFILEAYY